MDTFCVPQSNDYFHYTIIGERCQENSGDFSQFLQKKAALGIFFLSIVKMLDNFVVFRYNIHGNNLYLKERL